MKAYIAGPLFSIAERNFNLSFAKALETRLPGLSVILPQVSAEPEPYARDLAAEVYENCMRLMEVHTFANKRGGL